jgi:hypothetical protein
MTPEGMKIAELSEEQLAELEVLEQQLGTLVVALEPAIQLARLNREQLALLQAAEEKLGVVLLAYQKK